MKPINKPLLVSGIKPSGDLHIGNYIGALSQWLSLQEDYQCYIFLADYHAITVYQEPEILRKRGLDIIRTYLAVGLDPKQCVMFRQSDISAHTELGWIMNTIAKVSELEKMTQYKDYVKKEDNKEGPGAGLLNYPTLMAADVLLYNAEIVPVGDDQTQHNELTRTLARRFNTLYGETFTVPKSLIKKSGARIMQINDPAKKMSKSDPAGCIFMNEDPLSAHKKIKKAVTDSETRVLYNREMKAAISNLIEIYSSLSGKNIQEIEMLYEHKSYGEFKEDLANIVAGFLENFQNRFNAITDDEVHKILNDGAVIAKAKAEETMKLVKKNLGIN